MKPGINVQPSTKSSSASWLTIILQLVAAIVCLMVGFDLFYAARYVTYPGAGITYLIGTVTSGPLTTMLLTYITVIVQWIEMILGVILLIVALLLTLSVFAGKRDDD